MKEKLLAALRTNPTLASKGPEFLDSLTEDLLAVTIQMLNTTEDDSIARLDMAAAVDDLYVGPLGLALHNALFHSNPDAFNTLPEAARKRIERAMLQTFLLEAGAAHVFSMLPGDFIKARLAALAT